MIRALVTALLVALAVPGTIDTWMRVALRLVRKRKTFPEIDGFRPERVLVVIPSRGEGVRIAETLQSVAHAASQVSGLALRMIALLDGHDDEAEAAARRVGAEVIVKRPAGPRKADALQWFATHQRSLLEQCELLVMLDVGTEAGIDFFTSLTWRKEIDAMQCPIASSGSGIAQAIGASEGKAFKDDAARVAVGWNPRLRGSGMIATPRFFLELVPRLRTQVEDWELSLLAGARGFRVGLAPEGCLIIDRKPIDGDAAARQRARWLVGQFEMLTRGWRELLRFIRRDPLQGTSFTAELLSRPRSLALPLRFAAGLALAIVGWRSWTILSLAAAVLLTLFVDCLEWAKTPDRSLLVKAWIRAVSLIPAARKRWMRADDR